ncbi:MAG: DUF2062 domain-containing protein [Bdellovibrionales bacterium]|nr:DUF2062 domain-containing protein [Bdellovibrionales bacterium]
MILRVCVVIPCFNNPRTISSVLKDVVNKTSYPILVLDDGSETPVTNVLYSFEVRQALEQGRLRVVRFDENRGKGAVLRYAIQDLMAKGFTHMLTMDGNGRQLASQIPKLTRAAAAHPWALIVGRRNLKTDPPTRMQRWGRQILNFCVRFETGESLKDTQSGFRIYPLFSLQMMRFRTRRYDWEMEALIRLLWSGVQVHEVDVDTAPFNASEHVVHFHRIKDSLRLSLLKLALIAVSLVRTHATAWELGLSVAVGVFVGATPLFGFHTLILIALAFVLPLNFVAMYIGSHVGIPVLIPFLLVAEVYIGQVWLGIPTGDGLMGHFLQWSAGSVVLGMILGVPAGLLTYWAVRTAQNPHAEADLAAQQAGRHHLFVWITETFGVRAAYAVIPFVVVWRYLVLMRARRGLNEFYRVMMPGQGFFRRQLQVLGHLRRCAEIQADGLALACGRHPGIITRHDGNLNGSARVVISAHLGSWEAASAALQSSPQLYYGDRSSGYRYELIPFMGRLAPFDVTPFQQAARLQAPLAFSFGLKTEGGIYDLFSRPAMCYEFRGDTAEDLQILEWASRFVRQLEFYVRKYPDQWFNLYPFWSALPPRHEVHAGVFMEDLEPVPPLQPQRGADIKT